MKFSDSNILERSNVHISGRGRQSIVLLHCFGGNQNMWRSLAPAFEDRYQVVLLDLVGCGGPGQATYSAEQHGTLQSHASNLLETMRVLALHDAIFVGHSISAMVGLLAASKEPERFARLVLLAPSPRFANGRNQTGGFEEQDINELMSAVEGDYRGWPPFVARAARQPELVMSLTNSFVRTNPEIARYFARVNFFSDTQAEMGFLGIPTLIVQSARDVLAPLAIGHYLHEHLPNSQVVVIDTDSHSPHLSAPEATRQAIDDFLARID